MEEKKSNFDYLSDAEKAVAEFEQAEKSAGLEALGIKMDDHLNTVLDLRKQYNIEDVDLFSTSINAKTNIPEEAKKKVQRFQYYMRAIIEKLSQRIEEHKYKSWEEVLAKTDIGRKEKEEAFSLLKSEKAFHISCQTLKVTVEVFAEFNKQIYEKLEKPELDVATQRNLVLGNAVLVFELTDFVINYIENFKVEGFQNILEIQKQMQARLQEAKKEEEEIKKDAEKLNTGGEFMTQNAKARIQGIETCLNEWNNYVISIKDELNKVKTVENQLDFLKLMRRNAQAQVKFLELVAVLHIVKNNLGAINTTLTTFQDINLVSLTPERLSRLFPTIWQISSGTNNEQ